MLKASGHFPYDVPHFFFVEPVNLDRWLLKLSLGLAKESEPGAEEATRLLRLVSTQSRKSFIVILLLLVELPNEALKVAFRAILKEDVEFAGSPVLVDHPNAVLVFKSAQDLKFIFNRLEMILELRGFRVVATGG